MEILSAHLCQTKYFEHSINKKMRKRSIIVRHGEVHAVDQEEMHIDRHNPYQNFKSMSGLPCMLSKSSIRHVINVLDILSHTD